MPDDESPRPPTPDAPAATTPEPAVRDVALLCGPAPSGDGMAVLRLREGKLSAGVVQPLREGVPLHTGEVVKLHPHQGNPRVCDVTVEHVVAPEERSTVGPVRVANTAYRTNWDRIFGTGGPRDIN